MQGGSSVGSGLAIDYDPESLHALHAEFLSIAAYLEAQVDLVLSTGLARDLASVDVLVPAILRLPLSSRIDTLEQLLELRGWSDISNVVRVLRRVSKVRNQIAHAHSSSQAQDANSDHQIITLYSMRHGRNHSVSYTRADIVGLWHAARGAQRDLDVLFVRAVPSSYWGIEEHEDEAVSGS